MAKRKEPPEGFREVPGYPGYFVSEEGVVIGRYGRPKKPQLSPEGFHRVNCQVNGKAKKLKVHEAVIEAFGPDLKSVMPARFGTETVTGETITFRTLNGLPTIP